MILVFDLDDTLYEELSFVRSGFMAVAEYISALNNTYDNNKIYHLLLETLNQKGRGKIFDMILQQLSLYSQKRVKECIKIYRYHNPTIKLYDDAKLFLEKYKNITKYVVTDGNKFVQLNKARALHLDKYIKRVIPTRVYGIKYEKPSPYVFLKIAETERVNPREIVYFGDNPYKDFVGIKPYGFKTMRLLRGQYSNVFLDEKHEADILVSSFDNINLKIIS